MPAIEAKSHMFIAAHANGAVGGLAWKSGATIIVMASLLLEIHQFDIGVKLGNVIFAVICLLVFRAKFTQFDGAAALDPANFIMFCYLSWAVYSAAYSPAPVETIFQAGLAGILWISVMSVKSEPLAETLHIIFIVSAIVALLSVAAYLFDADFAAQPFSSTGHFELRGIFEHQLRLGMFTGIAAGLLVIGFINGDLAKLRSNLWPSAFYGGAIVIVIALYLSQARSPTAALALALASCCALAAPQKWFRYTAMLAIALGAFVVNQYSQELSRIVFTTESDLTFSGRVNIWKETWSAADLQSWTGYGFASFSSPFFDGLWVHYRPASAHNSLLQSYFETGYVGALLMLGFVVALLARGMYLSFKHRIISYTLFLTLYGVFCSLMSVIYGGKLSIFMTFVLLISAQERSADIRPVGTRKRAWAMPPRRRQTLATLTGKVART